MDDVDVMSTVKSVKMEKVRATMRDEVEDDEDAL